MSAPETMTASDPAQPTSRRTWFWIAVWALLAAGLAYAASGLAWAEVWAAAKRADPRWLALSLILNLGNVPLWAACWRCLAPEAPRTTYPNIARLLAVVLTFVQAFSLFAGGATAFLLLRQQLALPRPAVLSLLLLDQLTTGLVKVLLIGGALVVAPAAPAFLHSAGLVLLGAMVCCTILLIEASRSRARLHRIAARMGGRAGVWVAALGEGLEHLKAVRSLPRMSGAFIFMLARRVAEGIAAYCVTLAMGIPVGPEFVLIAIASLAIVTLIPSPPGNVGLYEAAVVAAYGWLGVEPEVAVAAALLQHVTFLAAALVPGALVLAFARGYARKP